MDERHPALPISHVAFDHSVEQTGDVSNMTAEQYMSWVRHQAQQLPAVVRATNLDTASLTSNQTKYMPAIPSVATCPSAYLPTEEWENHTLAAFSDMRYVCM